MNALIESSALVKMLLIEPGHEKARAAWEVAERTVASSIAYPETRAAIAAAARDGRINDAGHGEAFRELERRWRHAVVVPVTEDVARLAGDLAEEQGLRGCDAIHLATAAIIADPHLLLVTWDPQLSAAAERLGIATEPRFE